MSRPSSNDAAVPVMPLLMTEPIRLNADLPVSQSTLFDRDDELALAREAVLRPEVRLLTLTGPGGVGKTRLALALIADPRVAAAFPDGIVIAPLAPLADAATVPSTIAVALDLRDGDPRSPLERVLEHLHRRRVLLMLDNFEHLLPAASVVSSLLAGSDSLTVVITSRERLRISGEHELAVPPLAISASAEPMGGVTTPPAVRLFLDRAAVVEPAFNPSAHDLAVIGEICRRCDGLPLAIELAAARLKLLPPAAMLARLDRRLPLLSGGPRDAPARHRTIRDAIAWSYDLLTPREQALFRRFAVFAGGFSLEAAEAVFGGDPAATAADQSSETTLDLLALLVDKSLIRRIGRPDADVRFGMLDTIREFGLEQLVASGEAATARRAHAAYMLALAETSEEALLGGDQALWLGRLDLEHDNLRATLTWYIDDRDAERALRLATALWRFWEARGHLLEGQRWFDRALDLGPVEPALRAKALNNLGNIAIDLADFDRAQRLYEESLTIRRELGDRHGIASTVNNLGLLAGFRGDFHAARTHHEEALAVFRDLGDRSRIALVLGNLGDDVNAVGDLDRAWEIQSEALAIRREIGDSLSIAYALNNLGDVAVNRGEIELAERLLTESLDLFRQVGSGRGLGYALHNAGRAAARAGRWREAARRFGDALASRRRLVDRRGIAETLDGLAGVARASGHADVAARLLGAADNLRTSVGAPLPPVEQATDDMLRAALRRDLGQRFELELALGASSTDDALASAVALVEEFDQADERAPSPVAPSPGRGGIALTPRETDVLRQIAVGRTNQEIADELFVSRRTVSTHVEAILGKLEVQTRTAAAAWAVRNGIV